jgi:hypothetical protein
MSSQARQVCHKKIKCLEELTKLHEKLKCSHASLVERNENLSIEQTNAINFLFCAAQLEGENYMLKYKVESSLARMINCKKIMMSSCALMRIL